MRHGTFTAGPWVRGHRRLWLGRKRMAGATVANAGCRFAASGPPLVMLGRPARELAGHAACAMRIGWQGGEIEPPRQPGMDLRSDMAGDQPGDAFAMGRQEPFARIVQALGRSVVPGPAIEGEYDLDDGRIFQNPRDGRSEHGSEHAGAAPGRFRLLVSSRRPSAGSLRLPLIVSVVRISINSKAARQDERRFVAPPAACPAEAFQRRRTGRPRQDQECPEPPQHHPRREHAGGMRGPGCAARTGRSA